MRYEDCIGTANIIIEPYCDEDEDSNNFKREGERNSSSEKKEAVLILFQRLVFVHQNGHETDDVNVDLKVDVTIDKRNEKLDTPRRGALLEDAANVIEKEGDSTTLYAVISDGLDTYHARIPIDFIKLSSSPTPSSCPHTTKLDQVANILLHSSKGYTVVYTFSQPITSTRSSIFDSSNNIHISNYPFVNIVIKQAFKNIVKIIYTGEFLPHSQCQDHHLTCDPENSIHLNGTDNGMLELLQSLTKSMHQNQTQLHTINQQLQKTTKQLHTWKDTATKLERSWQDEKDETLHNYLVLLNRVKDDLYRVKEELNGVNEQNMALRQKMGGKNSLSKSSGGGIRSSHVRNQTTNLQRQTSISSNQSSITAATQVTSSQPPLPKQSPSSKSKQEESQISMIPNPYTNDIMIFPNANESIENQSAQLLSLISSSSTSPLSPGKKKKGIISSSGARGQKKIVSQTSPISATSSTISNNDMLSTSPKSPNIKLEIKKDSSLYLSSPISSSTRRKRKARSSSRSKSRSFTEGEALDNDENGANGEGEGYNDQHNDSNKDPQKKKKRVTIKEEMH